MHCNDNVTIIICFVVYFCDIKNSGVASAELFQMLFQHTKKKKKCTYKGPIHTDGHGCKQFFFWVTAFLSYSFDGRDHNACHAPQLNRNKKISAAKFKGLKQQFCAPNQILQKSIVKSVCLYNKQSVSSWLLFRQVPNRII